MVIKRYIPRQLTNGIIKNTYRSEEDISVDVSSINTKHHDYIYKTAIFEDNESYFQSTSLSSSITLTFKKYIFISHFAIKPRIIDSASWYPPQNVSLVSCLDEKCTINHKEETLSKYKSTKMILTPVIPSVSKVFNFFLDGVIQKDQRANFHAIGRLEMFGFSCDTKEECNGKLMYFFNTYKVQCTKHVSYIIYMIFVISK